MFRPAYFACVGLGAWAHWVWTDPSYDGSTAQSEWSHVLAFSALLMGIALAMPLFAQLVDHPRASRAALVPAGGFGLGSLVNIVEDGFGQSWAFFLFIATTLVGNLGLLLLAGVTAVMARGSRRLLALVPFGTLAGIGLYVVAGGWILAATWLGAAALAPSAQARTGAGSDKDLGHRAREE